MSQTAEEWQSVADVDYWRSLNPDATITDYPYLDCKEAYRCESETMSDCLSQIKKEGYFKLPPLLDWDESERLRDIVSNVVAQGHRPTYALLYDQFYQVIERLGEVLSPVLGPDYRLLPDEFEVYYIPADDGATGTQPHRDKYGGGANLMKNGLPKVVNVWVPLTDVSTLHSCIHVLPAHLDPTFPRTSKPLTIRDKLSHRVKLQDSRALPAQAGSLLCWDPAILHWGSRSSCMASGPRISFAVYFQRGDIKPVHGTSMPIPAEIPFEFRRYLVEKVWRDPEGDELCGFLSKFRPGS